MPYINQEERKKMIDEIRDLAYTIGESPHPGQVNFAISKLLYYLYFHNKSISYKNINEVIGILECTKQELYRRLAFYEDDKCEVNGDVFDFDK